MKKALPVGIENFEDMRTNGYYYVDKTLFIKELLDLKGKVNLFTRPRRFGKTLNLSMLRYFFEDTGDAEKNAQNRELFDGLKIIGAGETYVSQMGRYPVMNLTLKSAKQEDFPPEELRPFSSIRELTGEGKYKSFGCFEEGAFFKFISDFVIFQVVKWMFLI